MKPFKEFFIDFESNTFLEYAHNTVFGAAQSIKAHNGKGGGLGVGLDAKIPHIVGDRQEEIRPGTYIRGCKQFNDILAKIGCDFEYGKKLENYKNSYWQRFYKYLKRGYTIDNNLKPIYQTIYKIIVNGKVSYGFINLIGNSYSLLTGNSRLFIRLEGNHMLIN